MQSGGTLMPFMATARLQLGTTCLLVVDLQEKLVPAMNDSEHLVQQVGRLIDGVSVLEVPILVTEQYRKGLGTTVPELARRLGGAVCNQEKLKFSACIEPVRQQLTQSGARTVLVCGLEAHVCVLQTCLDLLDNGFVVAVATDAIGSRRRADLDAAVLRMVQAGVLSTTVESALFELVHEADGQLFKAILPIVR